MLRSILVLAVVYLAAAEDPSGPLPGLRGIIEPRLFSSGIRIARLERVIKDLKGKLDEASKVDPQRFLNEMNTRLDGVENKGRCENARDVRCGRDSAECISTLVMCDGVEDCHNGWDEDEKTCSRGPIVAGNVFSGTAEWTSCKLRKDHPVSFQISVVLQQKFFGPRLIVRARITADFAEDEGVHSYETKGYYIFGMKKLVLIPLKQDSSENGIVCQWNRGDDSRALCKLVNEATLSECAHFFVHLQD